MTTPVIDLVSVRRPFVSAGGQSNTSARMTISPENATGPTINVPFAPRVVSHSDLGGSYTTISPPGLTPYTLYTNAQQPRMSFTIVVADKKTGVTASIVGPSFVTSAMSVISAIEKYARDGTRVRITYGQLESGLWFIDSMSLESVQRHVETDEITQANVELSFSRVTDVITGVGPLTGGVAPPSPAPAPTPPQTTSARYYTFKQGDTLWGVSIKFYGTGTRWTEIADANGITNPRTIPIGKVVRVP